MIPAQQAKQIEEKKYSPKKDKNNPEVFSRQEKTFGCSCRPWKTKIRTKLGSKPLFTVSVDFGRAKPFGGFQRLQFDRFGLPKKEGTIQGTNISHHREMKNHRLQFYLLEGICDQFLKGRSTKQSKNLRVGSYLEDHPI